MKKIEIKFEAFNSLIQTNTDQIAKLKKEQTKMKNVFTDLGDESEEMKEKY